MNLPASYLLLMITPLVIACGKPSNSIESKKPVQRVHWHPAARALPEPCPDQPDWATQHEPDGVQDVGMSSRIMNGQRESMRTSSVIAFQVADQDNGAGEVIRLMSGDLSAFAMPSVLAPQEMDLEPSKTIPAIEGLSITSAPHLEAIYDYGEIIEIKVEFDGPVQVRGRPYLLVEMRSPGTRNAYYDHGSGTEHLYFQYRVGKRDWDKSGLCVFAGQVVLNGGTINAVSDGSKACLHHTGLPDNPNHRVNGCVGG